MWKRDRVLAVPQTVLDAYRSLFTKSRRTLSLSIGLIRGIDATFCANQRACLFKAVIPYTIDCVYASYNGRTSGVLT